MQMLAMRVFQLVNVLVHALNGCFYVCFLSSGLYACMYVSKCVIFFSCRQLEATVVCDCHILWLIEVLLEFQSPPSGFLTCSSANPMLDGQDVENANATIINDTCPGKGC